MGLVQEYYDRYKNILDRERRILFAIVSDLRARSSLREGWEMIDEEIQEEVLQKWLSLIQRYVNS